VSRDPTAGPGTVEALFVTTTAGAPMQPVAVAEAVVGRGLANDRYAQQRGHWAGGCEVTLLAAEALEAIAARTGLALAGGEHRRNVVTRGVDCAALAGRRVTVGVARLAYTKPRPPCAYLEGLTEPGMRAALGEHAGVCANVLTGGRIHRGDAVVIEG